MLIALGRHDDGHGKGEWWATVTRQTRDPLGNGVGRLRWAMTALDMADRGVRLMVLGHCDMGDAADKGGCGSDGGDSGQR